METILTTLLIVAATFCNAQIPNSGFEEWETTNGTERLVNWDCDGYFLDACTKVEILTNNFAVRMDNSLPCATANMTNTQYSDLGNGDLSTRFDAPNRDFTLNYDLVIDSIDQPASFIIRIIKSGINEFFRVEHDEVSSATFTHNLSVPAEFNLEDFLVIMEPVGLKKIGGEHDCDLGYISAIIDNMQVSKTVNTDNISQGRIAIFPNPSTGILNIQSSDKTIDRIEIYDMLGRSVYTQKIENSNLVSLNLDSRIGKLLLVKIVDKDGKYWLRKIILSK